MLVVNFGQYLLVLAVLWGGYLLLSLTQRGLQISSVPFLKTALAFLRKVVLYLAVLVSFAIVLLLGDLKQILAYLRESVGEQMETFLRNGIEVLFNTRSFFAVTQILIHGFIAFSTTICGTAMLVSQLVCLCVLVLRYAQRPTKQLPQKQQFAQTTTLNIYNHQRKYFIRA